ncbi:MAG: response regulator [Ktedonobacteraceae bacterium]
MLQDQEQQAGKDHAPVKTILVVEDDTDIGMLIDAVISAETSYQTLWVTDGLQALKVVQDTKPDMFLLDYFLPLMDGIELYDRLHALKELETIPTVMMSARLPTKEIEKRKILGLRKPFELQELLDMIEGLLP